LYLVVSAACIVLGGQAADRFGARLASMDGSVAIIRNANLMRGVVAATRSPL